uniref:Uncharacterized protein n=1 Tax=Sphaerodactylus townsendi TaxID=933632 RepID=A0ACB8G6Y2_9SAUR
MIEWSLQAGSGPEMAIAELKDGKLEWQNTTNRFRQRLEVADGTTLRIRALEKEEDNCTLKTRVLFASGDVLRQSFLLSVFGTYGSLFLCWFLSWLQVWDFGCGRPGAAQEVFHSAEFQRVEVQKMKSPPEGDGEQDPDCFSTCLPEIPRKMPPVTVKATLKALDKKDDAFART